MRRVADRARAEDRETDEEHLEPATGCDPVECRLEVIPIRAARTLGRVLPCAGSHLADVPDEVTFASAHPVPYDGRARRAARARDASRTIGR